MRMNKGGISMEVYTINETTIEKANKYIPVSIKNAFVKQIAPKCIERVGMRASENGVTVVIPDMNKENTEVKYRYLMGALVGFYLNAKFDVESEEDDFLMSMDEYDKWAGGHILNQIERFKSDMKLRDMCFDIIQDYKDLEKRLNSEIYSLVQVSNEPVSRLIATMQLTMSEEALNNMIEKTKEMQEEISKLKDMKKEE